MNFLSNFKLSQFYHVLIFFCGSNYYWWIIFMNMSFFRCLMFFNSLILNNLWFFLTNTKIKLFYNGWIFHFFLWLKLFHEFLLKFSKIRNNSSFWFLQISFMLFINQSDINIDRFITFNLIHTLSVGWFLKSWVILIRHILPVSIDILLISLSASILSSLLFLSLDNLKQVSFLDKPWYRFCFKLFFWLWR